MDLKKIRAGLNRILGNPIGVQAQEVASLRDAVHEHIEGSDAMPSNGVETEETGPAPKKPPPPEPEDTEVDEEPVTEDHTPSGKSTA